GPASPGRGSSRAIRVRVTGGAKAAEDLAPDGEVPVAEGVARHRRSRRPGRAAQHHVLAAEEHLGVLAIGEAAKTRVAPEFAAGPLVHVTEQLLAAECAGPGGIGSDRRGSETALVQVGVPRLRWLLTPRVAARAARVRIPGGRDLPLELRRPPASRPAA